MIQHYHPEERDPHDECRFEIMRLNETIKTLATVCGAVLDDMEDRYDGCPDSNTLWMGQHMLSLKSALNGVPAQ